MYSKLNRDKGVQNDSESWRDEVRKRAEDETKFEVDVKQRSGVMSGF